MKKKVLLGLLAVLLVGCAETRHVRKNMLNKGMDDEAFVSAWGSPDKSYLLTDVKEYPYLAVPLSKGRAFDVWRYDKHGATLVFYHGRLKGWKWDDGYPQATQ